MIRDKMIASEHPENINDSLLVVVIMRMLSKNLKLISANVYYLYIQELCFSRGLISRQIYNTGLPTEIKSVLEDIRCIVFLIFVGAFTSSLMKFSSIFLRKVQSTNISASGKNPFLLIITFRPEVHEASSVESLSHITTRILSWKMPSKYETFLERR